MFRPIYRPSSGVIFKYNILKKLLTFNGSVDLSSTCYLSCLVTPCNNYRSVLPSSFQIFRSYFAIDGQSALVSGLHLGPMTRFLLRSDIFGFHVVGRPAWRENGSVIYSYNSLSLSGPSPTELMTTSYCLIWDCWVPFLSPLTVRRAAVEVF
jgi:hypothetical protein